MKDLLFDQTRSDSLQVKCEYCRQPAGKPCVDRHGEEIQHQAAHFVRITASGKASVK